MKVVVFSHSYLEPENQKNIVSLSRICAVRCIVPRFGAVNIWKKKWFQPGVNHDLFQSYSPLYLTKSQYILLSLTLGLGKIQPDVINIEYDPWSLQFIQLLMSRMFTCPQAAIVCTIKKNTFISRPGFKGAIKNIIVKYVLGKVDHFIAVSQKAADMLEKKLGVPAKQISIAHQLGVDIDLFKPKKKTINSRPPFVVGYCGRLDEEKGVSDLVEAVRLLNKNAQIPVLLRLLGHSAYSGFLDEQLKKEAQQSAWLNLLPGVPNDQVAAFLNELDVFVLPARVLEDHEEHDAHALLEALAVGIPCVGTKSGITPDILQDEVGLLVNPENITELSAGIKKLLDNSELRQKLSEKSRRRSEDSFSLDAVAVQKLKIYTEVKDEELELQRPGRL